MQKTAAQLNLRDGCWKGGSRGDQCCIREPEVSRAGAKTRKKSELCQEPTKQKETAEYAKKDGKRSFSACSAVIKLQLDFMQFKKTNRNPKSALALCAFSLVPGNRSCFGLRPSDFFRVSAFEFRISEYHVRMRLQPLGEPRQRKRKRLLRLVAIQ